MQWQEHFKSVAAVKRWNDADKLLWLHGRAQTAFKRLPEAKKATYSYQVTAAYLTVLSLLASKRELHIVECQTRRCGEGWADFGDNLRVLADRA